MSVSIIGDLGYHDRGRVFFIRGNWWFDCFNRSVVICCFIGLDLLLAANI